MVSVLDPNLQMSTVAVDVPPTPRLSVRDYFYWVLLLALAPLLMFFLQPELPDGYQRLERVLEAHPDLKRKLENPQEDEYFSLEDLLKSLPGERLDDLAYLPRSSQLHWIFAGLATAGFFALTCLLFTNDMSQRKDLLLVGLFTGTLGVVLLLGVKSLLGIHFLDALMLSNTKSNIFVRLIGYTLSAGLFEELFKAVPLLWRYRQKSTLDWRGACLWGMASGVGFGVSEGIVYSSLRYNGIAPPDLYWVRFVSCVALHAVWSASVGITLSKYHRYIRGGLDELVHGEVEWHEVVFPVLRVLAIPMFLHGLYDTLIERETYALGLLVALLSFARLGWQIETNREKEALALAAVSAGGSS